jgi:hypothetical protein
LPPRVFAPAPIGPRTAPNAIRIFISSAQEEFADLRYKLRDVFGEEYLYNERRTREEEELVHQGVVTQGYLVEKESDESFDLAMKRGIESSQMYVGIFGKRYSKPTVKEYHAARKLGLPLFVYYYTRPPSVSSDVQNRVVEFLNKDVKPFITVRGNFRRLSLQDDNDLVDQVLMDVGARITDLVRESVAVRRMILEKTPAELLAAVLRARTSVFD